MNTVDPYLTFRWVLAIISFGLIFYDVIGLVVWYRGLPRLAQRIIILKLLRLRSGALRGELLFIIFLVLVQGWLTVLIFTTG